MSDLLEGVQLSDFLLIKCINRGGVADVYRGRQVGEGNYEVAVKVFRPGYAQRESFREYFMSEAEKIGQFEHPNILPFLEFGEGEGLLYAVTPFIQGGTLADLLKQVGGKFSAMQALPIMQQLCSAVQYAHDRDVIHGNIKPSNVFVAADGRMLLSDFGIVRGYDDSQQSLTRVGWGSAEYAAPEQSLGVLRRASDIYALGVLLFRILTGQPPFTGQTPVEVLLKHVRQQAPSARSIDPSISDAVDGVLQMAMQKRSDDRFASAEEFSNALLAAVTVSPVASPVARSVPTRQLTHSQIYSTGEAHTPTPPSNVAVTPPPVVTPGPSEQFDAPSFIEMPLQQMSPAANTGNAGSSPLESGGKHFLQDEDDAGTHLFWSTEPVEWSPIGNAQPIPLTAADLLRSKPVEPDVPPIPPKPAPLPAPEPPKKKDSGKAWQKKLLPVLVVILLLLGLAGALFSSFLFPGPSTGPASSQTATTPTSGMGVTATAATTPGSNSKGTATPASATPTVIATTAVQPTPSPTPVPIPTNPVVPSFICRSGSITLDGSANFLPAIQQLTTDYTNQCGSSGTFSYNADDSQTGLNAVANGSADLAYSDLPSRGRSGLVDYQVAALMYAVAVNSDTQVTRLTTAQLQAIYTGKITNWSQVGGSNESIVILTQPANSTIRTVFETYVLNGVSQSVSGTSAGLSVQNITGAITYMPLVDVPGGGAQSIAINGVSPTASSVASGAYPFWSIEHLYSNHAAQGLALSFISFCMTATGANDLTSTGAVPYKNMSDAALRSHLPGPTI